MQPIKPFHNEADDELVLQDINRCLDAAAGSPERQPLEVLTVLVDDYEAKHYPSAQDEIGSSGRISEVMNKQRPLMC